MVDTIVGQAVDTVVGQAGQVVGTVVRHGIGTVGGQVVGTVVIVPTTAPMILKESASKLPSSSSVADLISFSTAPSTSSKTASPATSANASNTAIAFVVAGVVAVAIATGNAGVGMVVACLRFLAAETAEKPITRRSTDSIIEDLIIMELISDSSVDAYSLK